ncbi:hypothetical protein [Mesobacillus stamsii]|nr:hypothetical protein [Mesobacillus stamsii]
MVNLGYAGNAAVPLGLCGYLLLEQIVFADLFLRSLGIWFGKIIGKLRGA